MANDTVKSQSLTNLDATPFLMNNAGQGNVAVAGTVEDYCAATVAGLQSVGSYYKLIRVPTFALIKSLDIFIDKAPDAAAAKTIALDLNWVFSDSTDDGTPAFLQGLIPPVHEHRRHYHDRVLLVPEQDVRDDRRDIEHPGIWSDR